MHYSKESLGFSIELLAAEFENRTAVTYYNGYRRYRFSYAELSDRAHRFGAYLYAQGLRKGDRLLICGANCPEWTTTLLACGLTGIVLVPVDAGSSPDLAGSIAQLTEPRLIVTDRADLHNVRSVRALPLDEIFAVCRHHSADELREYDGHVGRNDLLEIVYTSGTTSKPKGVMISHGNLVANLRSLRLSLQYNPSWRFLSVLPLSHMLEQTVGCLAPLRFGCEIVYHRRKTSIEVREIIREHGITSIVAVPAVLRTMRRRVEDGAVQRGSSEQMKELLKVARRLPLWMRRRLTHPIRRRLGSRLTAFICGGGPLDRTSEDFFENLGVRVIQGYGLTEAAPIVACNSYEQRVAGSVGRVLKEQLLRLADDGEILVAGDNITSGYFKDLELSWDCFEQGWYRTGDIGRLDAQGNLFIDGRKKNMIVGASGMNIYPEDIEERLARHSKVADCVVFADERGNSLSLRAIVVSEDPELDVSSLRTTVNKSLEPHQQLDAVDFWPGAEFPKTATQKIRRQEVIDRYLCANAQEESSAGFSRAPVDKTNGIIARIAGVEEASLRGEMALKADVGLDSLQIAQLAIEIENHFGVEIDEAELSRCSVATVNSAIFARRLAGHQQRKEKSHIPSRLRSICGAIVRWVFELLFLRLVLGVRIRGRSSKVHEGRSPVIFVANHQGHLDTPAVLSALPVSRRAHIAVAAAGDYFFDRAGWWRRTVARVLPLFPFSRDDGMRKNMATIGRLLDGGMSVLIYPEGTRSRDGSLQPFRPGIGHIVGEMGVPVIPIHIDGSYDVLPADRVVPRRGDIEVTFGERIRLENQSPDEITALLQYEVGQLSMRGGSGRRAGEAASYV